MNEQRWHADTEVHFEDEGGLIEIHDAGGKDHFEHSARITVNSGTRDVDEIVAARDLAVRIARLLNESETSDGNRDS